GEQRRDFVSVRDVARACRLALQTPGIGGRVVNVGSGRSVTIAEIAARMAEALGIDDLPAEVTHRFRVGDIRHCFADVGLAGELVDWLAGQRALDRVDAAGEELARRGLSL